MPDTRPVGDLTLAEMRALESIRGRMDAALRRLGELEVERHRLVGAVVALEGDSARTLSMVADRLNIPQNTAWSVDASGTGHVGDV